MRVEYRRRHGYHSARVALAAVMWIPLVLVAPPARSRDLPAPVPIVEGRAAPMDAPVVVLCPDIGESHEVFTARDGRGLGTRLAEERFSVWVVNPWETDAAHVHGFDGVMREVLPAMVRAVQVRTGDRPITWIGHGYCGLLPVLAAATPGAERLFERWVAIGTPLDVGQAVSPELELLESWVRGERPLQQPYRAALLTGLQARNGPQASSAPPSLRQDVHPEDVLLDYARNHLERLAPPAVAEQILRWRRSGSMHSAEGWLDYARGYGALVAPGLVLSGVSDPIASPATVAAVIPRFGAARVEARTLGREHKGREDYGHLGLLLSRYAGKDVDETIVDWLRGR